MEVAMATNEERIQILKMVQEGKITAEDAAQLLEALEDGEKIPNTGSSESAPPEPQSPGRKPRWLRVRVTDTDSGRPRVNVRLPLSMVNMGLKMGAHFAPEIEGMDTAQLMQVIEAGEIGQIVDVMDEKDGEHVEVYLE
jgi:hypothetical protein